MSKSRCSQSLRLDTRVVVAVTIAAAPRIDNAFTVRL